MSVFENLANLNLDDKRLEGELKAFGLAGQCGVLTHRGKYAESNRVMAQLAPIYGQADQRADEEDGATCHEEEPLAT